MEEVPTLFESLGTAIVAIHGVPRKSCGPSDLKRAAKAMGSLVAGTIEQPRGDGSIEMLVDLAVFEPNDRGIRPFDRFLAGPALKLPIREQDIARRMGCASSSICKLVEKHETKGTWGRIPSTTTGASG
jgi:hypothetical protein